MENRKLESIIAKLKDVYDNEGSDKFHRYLNSSNVSTRMYSDLKYYLGADGTVSRKLIELWEESNNKENSYTTEDVRNIIMGMIVFSNANNNQGLLKVNGDTWGDKAEHIIQSYDGDSFLPTFISKLSE